MKVVITGANGFVGRRLTWELHRAGHQVMALVREPSDARYPSDVRVSCTGDMVLVTDWGRWFFGAQAVIHLAARVHLMKDTAANPLDEYRRINVSLTRSMASDAARCGVQQFIYLSSLKAMAERSSVPLRVSDVPMPVDPYGVSKWEAERALLEIQDKTGLAVKIARAPLVYGPGVGGNFRRLLGLVRRGVPLPFGLIENRRSLISIFNLTDFMAHLLTASPKLGSVWLVSDDDDLSTPQLIRHIADAFGRSAHLIAVPRRILQGLFTAVGRQADFQRLCDSLVVDISPTRASLGWKPPLNASSGIFQSVKELQIP